jgi:lysozyme family protein
MADFNQAFDRMLAHEGGLQLSSVEMDRGGRTFAGISSRYWPTWPGWALVNAGAFDDPSLLELVKDFYRDEFWDAIQGDALLEQEVAESIFDFAVNAGLTTAIKRAQEVAGADMDGVAGPQTVRAVNALRTSDFLPRFALAKIRRYVGICESDATQKKFLLGWIIRALDGVEITWRQHD